MYVYICIYMYIILLIFFHFGESLHDYMITTLQISTYLLYQIRFQFNTQFFCYRLKILNLEKGSLDILKQFLLEINETGRCSAWNYLLKVNKRNTKKRCEIRSKLTIKTPNRRSRAFVVNFEHISHLCLVLLFMI